MTQVKTRRYGRVTRGDRLAEGVFYALLALASIICLYPVIFVVLASVSDAAYVNSGELLLWPKGFHLNGYKFVINDGRIGTGYLNTIIYTAGSTLFGLAVSLPAGYSLSRRDLPGRGIVMGLMVFTMYFSGGLIPTYLVVKSLGLLNTRAIMIILGSVSVYNIILIRTFFASTIPGEMQDAAFIDGCGNTRFFFQMALPLSSAIVAVIALYLAVGSWNAYFNAMIYLTDRTKKPLQILLREILMTQESKDIGDGELAGEYKRMVQIVKYAVIVVATLPIITLYPFLQRFFVKGVMIGSLKG